MPLPQETAQNPYACLGSIAVFLLIVTPIYLMLRYFVKLIRWSYGFDVPPEDPGPPLRICQGCHNTVLEPDFQHCPYCGLPLPAVAEEEPESEGNSEAEPAPDLLPDSERPLADEELPDDA